MLLDGSWHGADYAIECREQRLNDQLTGCIENPALSPIRLIRLYYDPMKHTTHPVLTLLVILAATVRVEASEVPEPHKPTIATSVMPAKAVSSDQAEDNSGKEEAAEISADITDELFEQMSAIAPPPQLSDREPGIHLLPCEPGISVGTGNVNVEDLTCGVLTVPQNWNEPDGHNLDLGFVIVRATGNNPDPDPLIFLAGGPGSSAVLSMNIKIYQGLRPDRDVILFDIRGAGASQRLGLEECLVLAIEHGAPAEDIEELQGVNARFLAVARGEKDTPAIPKPWELDLPVLNKICWRRFTAEGLDPSQFNTATNARDVVELIKALGYESFNIHGASYGTRLAMTIMDNIPEYHNAPALRSVVLDSTFPPSVYLVRTIVRSDHDFMLQLLEECQADAGCNQAYPDLKRRLANLLMTLEENPLTTNGETVTIDDVVRQLTDVGNTRAGYIPQMIAELETGVMETYVGLRDGELGTGSAESLQLLILDRSDPVQAFIADAQDLLRDEKAVEFILYVNIALAQDDPSAILQSIIADSYTDETGEQMLQMLAKLTAEDFASSPYVKQQIAAMVSEGDPEMELARKRRAITGGIPLFLYSSVHCVDDILHERFEDALNSYHDLLFPQLTDLKMSRAQAGRCENWPVSAAPIEVKDPVTSDVPAIVLQGAYDLSTPVYMGRRAARELENSTYIYIPQQGHGTWNNAESCVGQIATAFVQDPGAALDPGCLDARRPQWALPDNREP